MSATNRLTTLALLVLFIIGAAPEAAAQKRAEPVRESPPGLRDGFDLGDELAWRLRKAPRSSVVIEEPALPPVGVAVSPPVRSSVVIAPAPPFLREHKPLALEEAAPFLAYDGRFAEGKNREDWWSSWGRCTAGIVGGGGLGVLFAELIRNIPTDHQADKTVGIILGAVAGALAGVAQTC